jgi:adenosylhomocysteine nucleosidase
MHGARTLAPVGTPVCWRSLPFSAFSALPAMTLGILAALHDEVDGLIAAMRHEDARATKRDRDARLLQRHAARPAGGAGAGTDRQGGRGHDGHADPRVRCERDRLPAWPAVSARRFRVGDIVVADRTVQHDLDARPLFPRHEVPLLARIEFPADPGLTGALRQAAEDFLRQDLATEVPDGVLARFGARSAPAWGMIASGDQFIGSPAAVSGLREQLPALQAVEMEGAALAQICYEYGVPYALLRTISDRADDTAHVDFSSFLRDVASHYSGAILRRFLDAKA